MARKKKRAAKAAPRTVTTTEAALAAAAPETQPEAAASARDTSPVQAPRPTKAKRGGDSIASPPDDMPGMVRTSTLFLAVGVALALGLYLGTLIPTFTGGSPRTEATQPTAPEGQPGAQSEALERLAGQILALEEAVRKNPQDVNSLVQLGNLYFDTGKAQSSISAYERALAIKPGDANVLTDLGIMYREAGQYEKALESFRKATQADPGHQHALFNSGVVLFFDLGRKEDARDVWQQLLAINPDAHTPDGKPLTELLRDMR